MSEPRLLLLFPDFSEGGYTDFSTELHNYFVFSPYALSHEHPGPEICYHCEEVVSLSHLPSNAKRAFWVLGKSSGRIQQGLVLGKRAVFGE